MLSSGSRSFITSIIGKFLYHNEGEGSISVTVVKGEKCPMFAITYALDKARYSKSYSDAEIQGMFRREQPFVTEEYKLAMAELLSLNNKLRSAK